MAAFNRGSFHIKKGYALMPVCFGISFTATFLNQAGALLHVYGDGSISVSTGGVEMGQGLSSNLALVAAQALGVGLERVRVESTNTRRIANMSASAASATTLLNGNAVLGAAEQVRAGSSGVDGEGARLQRRRSWRSKASSCCATARRWAGTGRGSCATPTLSRVALSAHHFFATPQLHWSQDSQQGEPFAYHVYGTAFSR